MSSALWSPFPWLAKKTLNSTNRRAAPVGRLETSPPIGQEELASWAVPTLCPACKGSRGVQPHKYYNTLKPDKKSSDSSKQNRPARGGLFRACQGLPGPARACQGLPGAPSQGARPARACVWQGATTRGCQACELGLPGPCRASSAAGLPGPNRRVRSLPEVCRNLPLLGFQEAPGLPSGSRRVFVGGSISASCAEHPSIFSSTFSIFEAFCVARPHASWPDPAPISIPHGTFSAISEDHDPCPAHATAVPTAHIANGCKKLISTATEPVFAYPIKVARNSPTKPSAFHYASWFGHSVFSGPVVSSGNFVCSEGFGRNMKI